MVDDIDNNTKLEYKLLLTKLIKEKPDSYSSIIKSKKNVIYKKIYDYIIKTYNSKLKGHSISEYCYWFLNDLNDFPKCKNKNCINNHLKPLKFYSINIGYSSYCSTKCSTSDIETINKNKETNLKKYGVSSFSKTLEYRDKVKETNLKKYGVEVVNQYNGPKAFKDKYINTCKKLYNSENIFSSNYFKKLSEKTKFEKYNDKNWNNRELSNKTFNFHKENDKMFLEKIRNKIKNTCKQKYIKKESLRNDSFDIQATSYTQTQEYIDKIKETNLKKYGAESYSQTQEYIDKIKETNLKKYGVEFYSQTTEFSRKRIKKYFYDNNYFDSSWELCYYIYLKENNINFKYPVDNGIDYIDSKNIKHKYYPDFIVEGKFVEIKGNQFLDSDGSLKLPYKYEYWSDEQYNEINDIYKSKYKCMIDNNVKILYYDDIKDVINNIKTKINIDKYLIEKDSIPNEYFGWTQEKLVDLCLNNNFPGNSKYPAEHIIWKCNIENKLSPFEAWKDKKYITLAVKNLYKMLYKSETNKTKLNLEFINKIKNIFEQNNIKKILELVLARFTIAKIAPKVTALSPALVLKILEENNIDISNGIYCPMAGFGGIIEGCKRWYKKKNIDFSEKIEAYDINKNFCELYGWSERDVLAKKITTDKTVIACPPFGLTEQWIGTDKNNYYDFDTWCKLIKQHIIAKNYIFIGPEKTEDKINNDKIRYKSGKKPNALFRKKIQAVYRKDMI